MDKFYNFLKSQNVSVSKKTLHNYLDYLESSLFFHFLRSHKLRERLKKVYLNDVVFGEPDRGRRLENIVCLELLRRGTPPRSYEDKGECDFVLPKRMAVQVAWELNDENRKREMDGLEEALRYFQLKEGMIVTYNQEKLIRKGGYKIVVMPFWKWCLGREERTKSSDQEEGKVRR